MSDDMINHPPHYRLGDREVIEITEHLDFLSGNVVKYVCRAGRKEGSSSLEDYLKARWYLDRLIAWGPSKPPADLDRARMELKRLSECLVEATDVIRRLSAQKENNTDE
jgi:hypothetical protein